MASNGAIPRAQTLGTQPRPPVASKNALPRTQTLGAKPPPPPKPVRLQVNNPPSPTAEPAPAKAPSSAEGPASAMPPASFASAMPPASLASAKPPSPAPRPTAATPPSTGARPAPATPPSPAPQPAPATPTSPALSSKPLSPLKPTIANSLPVPPPKPSRLRIKTPSPSPSPARTPSPPRGPSPLARRSSTPSPTPGRTATDSVGEFDLCTAVQPSPILQPHAPNSACTAPIVTLSPIPSAQESLADPVAQPWVSGPSDAPPAEDTGEAQLPLPPPRPSLSVNPAADNTPALPTNNGSQHVSDETAIYGVPMPGITPSVYVVPTSIHSYEPGEKEPTQKPTLTDPIPLDPDAAMLGDHALFVADLQLQNKRTHLSDVACVVPEDAGRLHHQFMLMKPDRQDTEYGAFISHTVSVAGGTHAGKSFIINRLVNAGHLLNEAQHRTQLAAQPTTSGAHCILWTPTAGRAHGMPLIHLVDYEGSNGWQMPLQASQGASSWQLQAGETSKHLHALRNAAASIYLPRLAYLTSNVLIYITCMDPSYAGAAEEILSYMEAGQRDSLRDAPSLLVIFNKREDLDEVNEELDAEVEREWLEVHDGEGRLKSIFLTVRAMCFPSISQDGECGKVDSFTKHLRDVVFSMLQEQKRFREENDATLHTNHTWQRMYAQVAQSLTAADADDAAAASLSLADPARYKVNFIFLAQYLTAAIAEYNVLQHQVDAFVNEAVTVFRCAAICQPIKGDVKVFLKHLDTTLSLIAVAFGLNLRDVIRRHGTGKLFHDALAQQKVKLDAILDKAITFFTPSAPCSGTHSSKGVENAVPGEIIHCEVSRGDHDDLHRNLDKRAKVQKLSPNDFWSKLKQATGAAARLIASQFRADNAPQQVPRSYPLAWEGKYAKNKALDTQCAKIKERVCQWAITMVDKVVAPHARDEAGRIFTDEDISSYERLLFAWGWITLHRGLQLRTLAGWQHSQLKLLPSCALCLGVFAAKPQKLQQCQHTFCAVCVAALGKLHHDSQPMMDLNNDFFYPNPREVDRLNDKELNPAVCPFCT